MRSQAPQMYQGRDWASYRWTVAEAFDTLDRMHDLSLCQGWTDEPDLAETAMAFIPDLMGLYEELGCQLKIVFADILGEASQPQTLPQHWAMMEAQALHAELGEKITGLWENEATQSFSSLVVLTSLIKAQLKKMDQ